MTTITTLLIVLMLTGSPATTAVCATWCMSHGMSNESGCHEGIAQPVSARISDGSGTCAALQPAGSFDAALMKDLEPHFADLITDLEAFSGDPIL